MNWPEFRHEAMATTFALFIADQPADYARQAASAAWRELDRLEGELSRYVESSDIARANRIERDETIAIGDDALACLLLAAEISMATNGAFDAAYSSERAGSGTPFTLDPEAHALTSRCRRLHLDLGAIGKGYALDKMAVVLRDWEIASACLQSGGSTALTLAPPHGEIGWPIGLGEGAAHRTLRLTHTALSGSGIQVKGAHLIDPRTRAAASRRTRAWALAPSAAVSDALSTAFFVMNDEEVVKFCDSRPEIGSALARSDGEMEIRGALRTPLR